MIYYNTHSFIYLLHEHIQLYVYIFIFFCELISYQKNSDSNPEMFQDIFEIMERHYSNYSE